MNMNNYGTGTSVDFGFCSGLKAIPCGYRWTAVVNIYAIIVQSVMSDSSATSWTAAPQFPRPFTTLELALKLMSIDPMICNKDKCSPPITG